MRTSGVRMYFLFIFLQWSVKSDVWLPSLATRPHQWSHLSPQRFCVHWKFLAIDFLSLVTKVYSGGHFFHEWLVTLRHLSISFHLSCQIHCHKWILTFLRSFYYLCTYGDSKHCWGKNFFLVSLSRVKNVWIFKTELMGSISCLMAYVSWQLSDLTAPFLLMTRVGFAPPFQIS